MDAWRRYSYSMYHSGVKLAMRSQPRSKYPRYVYLQGRTEPCSELVIEGYGCLRVSCSSRRLLAESMTESKDRQERCLAADSLRQQDARPRRCQSTEPPYAEPLVRWCGRTHGELIPMLLPNLPMSYLEVHHAIVHSAERRHGPRQADFGCGDRTLVMC